MIKLLMFAPCERVVIGGEGDNSASLIAILQGFTLDLPETTAPPEEEPGSIPLTWYLFSLWEHEPSEHQYSVRFELIAPINEKILISMDRPAITQAEKRFHRNYLKLIGFPIFGFGDYIARVSLKTDDGEFVSVASFPIPISPSRRNS